ncbi:MAG: S-methyl-5-thioribose-1-phosphate isomerase [Anaerolineae bacterium]
MERTIEWHSGVVRMVDQRKLPHEYEIAEFTDHAGVARAIQEMYIRGAPAIGAAAGFGLALAAQNSDATSRDELLDDLNQAAGVLREARPTAVNLFWALDRVLKRAYDESLQVPDEIRQVLLDEAQRIADEDVEVNRRIGENGAALIPSGATVLHHCNTGSLATVDYGTALGVIRAAHEQGKDIRVLVDETRPRLQGAKLTTWELKRLGIPQTLIADNAAGYFLQSGQVNAVIVGADRVARNGDVANKIGTYKLAVLARENDVPFYVAAPTSTIDMSVASGADIPIEERDPDEVTWIGSEHIAPEGVEVANPAFDITPHRYITAIITEESVVHPPFEEGFATIFEKRQGG